ncbi:MAG: peptidoglycan-binding protein [Pseudomonadota bacterium]
MVQPGNPANGELQNIKNSLNQLASTISAISQSQRSSAPSRGEQDRVNQQFRSIEQAIGDLNANFSNFRQEFSQPSEIAGLKTAIDQSYRDILSRIDQASSNAIDPSAYARVVESSHAEIIDQLRHVQSTMASNSPATDAISALVQGGYHDIGQKIVDLENAVSVANHNPYADELVQIKDQLALLDQSVATLSTQEAEKPAVDLTSVEMRLEEVNRAIVAMSSVSQDTDNLDRIEARLIELSREMDTLTSQEPTAANEFPEFGKLEDHFRETNNALREIETRLQTQMSVPQSDAGIDNVSAELTKLGDKIDNLSVFSQGDNAEAGSTGSDPALLSRLDELVDRVEQLRVPTSGESSIEESELLRSLQGQVVGISRQLENFQMPDFSLDPITQSLGNIEQQLGASRDVSIEVAAGAAEEALRRVMDDMPSSSGGGSSEAIDGLQGDLRKLQETLSEAMHSDEHFAELKISLSDIAMRIGAVEASVNEITAATETTAPAVRTAVMASETVMKSEREMPVHAFAEERPTEEVSEQMSAGERLVKAARNIEKEVRQTLPKQEPQVAQEPSDIAMPDEQELDNDWRSEANEPELPDVGGPEMSPHELPHDIASDFNEPGSVVDVEGDRPLEPGEAAPDIAALVRQANERNKAGNFQEDNSGTDFLEAARKAAQAAAIEASAAEAEANAEKPQKSGRLTGSLKAIMGKRKKSVLMAIVAALLLTAAVPLVKNFMPDSGQVELADAEFAAQAELTALAEDETAVEEPVTVVTDVAQEQTATVVEQPQASLNELQESPSLEQTYSVASATQNPFDFAKVDFVSDPLKIAAEQNDPAAIFEIGRRYTNGIGTEKNLEEAARWYKHAANLGYVPAQYLIGNFSEKGVGVSKDRTIAEAWYEQAAENGHVVAMHNLAVMNATPDPVSGQQDLAKAHKWFVKAAEHGVRDSQVNAGIFYAKGTSGPVDLVESYKWFAVAAKSGDTDAAEKRDFIADAMRPDQLEEARKLVDDWKQTEPDPAVNKVSVPDSWKSADDKFAVLSDQNSIAQAQVLLAKMGFDVGPADGVLGQKTRDAIRNFRAKSGLSVNDNLDVEFMETLKAVSI